MQTYFCGGRLKEGAITALQIVNVSSLAAIQPFDSWGIYCTAKAAREMFHRVIAEVLHAQSIAGVALFSCSFIRTRTLHDYFFYFELGEQRRSKYGESSQLCSGSNGYGYAKGDQGESECPSPHAGVLPGNES
jgi:NAD(P)-dependent dehydrogenase (short-subunit alcohol dehydrogenase family)